MKIRNRTAAALFLTALAPLSLVACFPETAEKDGEEPQSKLVRAAKPVKGEYIVVFEQPTGTRGMATADISTATEQMLTPLGVKAEHQYTSVVQGFSVAGLTEAEALELANDPRVAYVQENGVVQLDATQANPPWGLDRLDQLALPLNNSYTYNVDGTGVTAFIIDTGIRATHTNFGGRVGQGFTSINDGQGTNDCQGHGTHVAGTVGAATYGVAKNVTLIPVRVLNCQGSGTDAGVIAGVDWVRNNHSGPSVANMSLGGGASPTLDTAIRNLVNAGVTTVVAAGNEDQNACNVSPAREPLAITVGATTISDARASFSNWGTCVDIFAPGNAILSTSNGSNTATATLSGTSMASPHVAGGAALYLSANPTATPAQVEAALETNGSMGRVTDPETGSPNILLNISFISGGGGNLPPTVSITAPANGSTVSGSITVSANAADTDGTVASVRFNLPDGTTVTDTTAPYSTTWNTATVANGSGTITATATDDDGATARATSTVTVNNGGQPGCIDGTFASVDVPKTIADVATANSTLAISGNGNVSTLALSLNLSHTYRGDLIVSLISPAGTSFVVSNRAGGSADNLVINNQAIAAFAGQAAAGTWTLRVQDAASGDVGTINSWSLRIVATCGGGGTGWTGSATPNLATVDNGSACSSLTVAGTGSSADAKLSISGRHDWRSILRGTLAHNGITVAAFPVNTFASGAGNFAFTDRAVGGLSGDPAGVWTLCIIDTDGENDTGTLASWSVHN